MLLADALQELPEDYREVIILRQLEGLSFPDVARRTGPDRGQRQERVAPGLGPVTSHCWRTCDEPGTNPGCVTRAVWEGEYEGDQRRRSRIFPIGGDVARAGPGVEPGNSFRRAVPRGLHGGMIPA